MYNDESNVEDRNASSGNEALNLLLKWDAKRGDKTLNILYYANTSFTKYVARSKLC